MAAVPPGWSVQNIDLEVPGSITLYSTTHVEVRIGGGITVEPMVAIIERLPTLSRG
jgi:hypothetical protein